MRVEQDQISEGSQAPGGSRVYNIADVDYTPLIPFEEAYLKAVSDDLPWWSEILWRRH